MIDIVLFVWLAVATTGDVPDSSGAVQGVLDSSARVPLAGSDSSALVRPPDSLTLARPLVPHSPAVAPRHRAHVADTVLTLPEVRVESERVIQARRRMPTAFVTELDAHTPGLALETLSEVLGQAAGVRIVQYGGLGSFSTVSLRGAPPGQVAIYLDGVPLTSAAHGVVNLADLPATAIERIEVYRGLAPLAWGAAMPGGAINLVTASSPELREVSVAHGSFGTREARGSVGGRRGPLAALVHAGWQGATGNFSFLDDNDTSLNPDDDVTAARINNDFDARTVLGTLTWSAPWGVETRLRGDHFHKRQGLPGRGADQARAAHLGFDRTIGQLELRTAGGGVAPEVTAVGSLGDEGLALSVHEDHLGLGRHESDDQFGDRNARLGLEWSRLPFGLGLEAAASARDERARLRDPDDGVPDPPESRRATEGVAIALRVHALRDGVTLHAARRWDRVRDRLRWQSGFVAGKSDVSREIATPQFGVRVAAPRGVELRANWTDTQRVPEFLELFGNQGATQGNPALLPERAQSWDAGLSWSRTRATSRGFAGALEYAHHASRTRDLIVFVRNSPNSSKAMNISRATIRGDELSGRFEAPGGISGLASLTWMSARDRGSVPFWYGKRLPQRPARQWYARLEWARGRLRILGDALFVGETFLDRYNRQPVPGRTLVGAAISWSPWKDHLRLAVEGKNLGDQSVADVGGYPLPGRSLYVSCQARSGLLSH